TVDPIQGARVQHGRDFVHDIEAQRLLLIGGNEGLDGGEAPHHAVGGSPVPGRQRIVHGAHLRFAISQDYGGRSVAARPYRSAVSDAGAGALAPQVLEIVFEPGPWPEGNGGREGDGSQGDPLDRKSVV